MNARGSVPSFLRRVREDRLGIHSILLLAAALLATTAPAFAQAIPLQLEGRLESGSEVLSDGSYVSRHSFEGTAGEIIAIELESSDFDAYLLLNDPQNQQIAKNNNGAGGKNARIVVKLSETGTYTVFANSYGAAATGAYRLNIRSGTPQELAVAEAKTEADRLLQQGIQQFKTSQFREALQSWEQALQLYREIGDRQGEAASLGSLGLAYDSLGQYDKAIDFHQQSLAIAREIGDRQGEANALGNLGNAYDSLGQYDKAIDLYQQALTIQQQIGDRAAVGIALSNIGLLLKDQEQPELSILFLKQSVNVRESIRESVK